MPFIVAPERVEQAWKEYSIPELLAAAATVGHGTGEELFDFLEETLGMHPGIAESLVEILVEAIEFMESE